MQIHALSGHENTVCSVFTRPTVSTYFVPLQELLMYIDLYVFVPAEGFDLV